MFSSTGLFKQVPCPKQDDCTLPNCIFSHDRSAKTIVTSNGPSREYDPLDIRSTSSPPAKKRKLDHDEEHRRLEPNPALAQRPSPRNVQSSSSPKPESISQPPPPPPPQALVSASRAITPPATKPKSTPTPSASVVEKKPDQLHPRSVPKAPDILKKRLVVLQGLYTQILAQNNKVQTGGSALKPFSLSDQEMVKFALDEEEQAAVKYESDIYRNHLSQLAFRIRKMSLEDWKEFVTKSIRHEVKVPNPADTESGLGKPLTGLDSVHEAMIVLRSLRTSLVGLENYGYVLKQPTEGDLTAAKNAMKAAAGWEKCDRCETRFQVFPGRDDKGRLTSGGACRYHWARSSRHPQKYGNLASTYPCCNKNIGSEGCTEGESHVFKVTDKKRLATIFQFEYTPANSNASKAPISLDCEMGYTTLGMEVIRLTAVSWPGGIELLDVLVRPLGEVLDLNTRFSGVSIKHFMEAPNCEGTATNAKAKATQNVLSKVSSPIEARQLLFNLISPETPLIGHAIDNDLNVLRVIHPVVIDTVLLYPHPKGLPLRFGLKTLASTHLNRHIQASGDAGHDSKEDAVATGDLVTKAVGEKWKKMSRDGWKFENGSLVAPEIIKKPQAPRGKAIL